jgi:hypothetical protein
MEAARERRPQEIDIPTVPQIQILVMSVPQHKEASQDKKPPTGYFSDLRVHLGPTETIACCAAKLLHHR